MQTTKRVRIEERERARRAWDSLWDLMLSQLMRRAQLELKVNADVDGDWGWAFFCCTLQLELLVKRSSNNNKQRRRQRSIERWQDNWWAYWVKWNEKERESERRRSRERGRLKMVFNECADKSDQSRGCCCACCCCYWRFEGNLPREVHLHSLPECECIQMALVYSWWVAVAVVVVVAPFAAYEHKATGEKAKQNEDERGNGAGGTHILVRRP